MSDKLFTPIQTFQTDGYTRFETNRTFVREGHPILDTYRHMFREVEASPGFEWPDVEAATANPGEKRGAKTHA